MRKIDQLLNEYGESHQNALNKRIHWICVPAIFFSIIGILWSLPLGPLKVFDSPLANWGTVALILVSVYYISLSIKLALGMILFSLLCMLICYELDQFIPVWKVSVVTFIIAWIGQFYGHNVEGKKPSFLKDLQFLLIGPAWLMHFIYRKAGLSY